MPDARPHPLAGLTTVSLTLIGWSSIPLFLRHFAESIDGWTSNGWRYGFSALLWAPLLIVLGLRRRMPPGIWRAAVIPSLVNATGQVCFTWAHYKIEPGLVTFGLRSQLLFVAVGAYLLFASERPIIRSRGYLLGLVLVGLGTSATILLDGRETTTLHLQGIVLAVLSGLLFAAYGLAVKKYMHGLHPVTSFAVICQYTALAMLALMLVLGKDAGRSALDLPRGQLGLLLLSAVIGIALGHVFYYLSIANLGVAVSAGVIQLQPFLATVGSMILFDERLTGAQWTGGFVALAGAAIMLWTQHRLERGR